MDEIGRWNDESCDENYHFMCITPQSAAIPDENLYAEGTAIRKK